MIDGIGLQRADQTDLIGNLGGIRQHFAQFHAALTVPLERELAAQQGRIRLDKSRSVALQQIGRGQTAIESLQLGLGIKQLQVAGRPRLKQVNDPFDLARKMRGTGGQRTIGAWQIIRR